MSMRVGCIGFTRMGVERAVSVARELLRDGDDVRVFGPARLVGSDVAVFCADSCEDHKTASATSSGVDARDVPRETAMHALQCIAPLRGPENMQEPSKYASVPTESRTSSATPQNMEHPHADVVQPYGELSTWVRRMFEEVDALLFVSACGIAVRAIAPCVRDKFCDPAVVCMDESAGFVVPLLSGHVGGANELARRVAHLCGGQAVITTATDVRQVFAADVWARQQGLVLLGRDVAKRVSAVLLDGGEVGFATDVPVAGAVPAGIVTGERGLRCDTGIVVSWKRGRHPFEHTLCLVPRTVTVGVGCRRGTSAADILALVDACLEEAQVAPEAVCALASIDIKAQEEGLRAAARERGWELRLFGAEELRAVDGEFSSSEFVLQTVGVDNVCERAACATGATLVLPKRREAGVTVALAVELPHLEFPASDTADYSSAVRFEEVTGDVVRHVVAPSASPEALGSTWDGQAVGRRPPRCVVCVGLGPGAGEDFTLRARAALVWAEVIVGYTTYVNMVKDDYPQATCIATPMREETQRCHEALRQAAAGRRVVVVCSGDPGVYGMAGLLLELAPQYPGVEVQVVPGVTAANGGAALLGAPLMDDWCCVSLSDLMTPWTTIERRLRAVAEADLCVVLYNPGSRTRRDHLRRACDILLACKDPLTVCGLARNVGREGETCKVLSLAELRDAEVDMRTCVFVGNARTRRLGSHMVTPRGYALASGSGGTQEAQEIPLGHDGGNPQEVRDRAHGCQGNREVRASRAASVAGEKGVVVSEDKPCAAPCDGARETTRKEVLVFGGTTEGRLITEWLAERGSCDVVSCTATSYGADLVRDHGCVRTVVGPLSGEDKCRLMRAHDFVCIVDATHAYAQHISGSIDELACAAGKEVVRILREEAVAQPDEGAWVSVPYALAAARHLAQTSGNVLLTTGSTDLAAYVEALPDHRERLYVRVLPVGPSVEAARGLGIPASHIIAMQGPFSTDLNRALIKEYDIAHLVTKQSGAAGGFAHKVAAAWECGIELVVIERPSQREGVLLEEAKELLEKRYGL